MLIWQRTYDWVCVLGEGRPVVVGCTSLEHAMEMWIHIMGGIGIQAGKE